MKRVVDSFSSSLFNLDEPGPVRLGRRLPDFAPFVDAQEKAGNTYRDQRLWTQMAVLNVARLGKFSSDRTIGEYVRDIRNIESM